MQAGIVHLGDRLGPAGNGPWQAVKAPASPGTKGRRRGGQRAGTGPDRELLLMVILFLSLFRVAPEAVRDLCRVPANDSWLTA